MLVNNWFGCLKRFGVICTHIPKGLSTMGFNIIAMQISLYVNKEQKRMIDQLPRKVSFSELVRNHFSEILADYPECNEETNNAIKKVR